MNCQQPFYTENSRDGSLTTFWYNIIDNASATKILMYQLFAWPQTSASKIVQVDSRTTHYKSNAGVDEHNQSHQHEKTEYQEGLKFVDWPLQVWESTGLWSGT